MWRERKGENERGREGERERQQYLLSISMVPTVTFTPLGGLARGFSETERGGERKRKRERERERKRWREGETGVREFQR